MLDCEMTIFAFTLTYGGIQWDAFCDAAFLQCLIQDCQGEGGVHLCRD